MKHNGHAAEAVDLDGERLGGSKSGLRQIIIEVMGDFDYRKFALQRVRDEVEDLHKKWFRNIQSDQLVPCCCDECKIDKDPYTPKLAELLNLKKGKAYCIKSEEFVPLRQLLEGVYLENEIKNFSEKGDGVRIENYHQHGGQTNLADKINKIKNNGN